MYMSKRSYPQIMFTNSHSCFFYHLASPDSTALEVACGHVRARLLPMGLPEDVTVIAWGIGCESHLESMVEKPLA